MNTFFITTKNLITNTITTRPISADNKDKAYTIALSLIGVDEQIVVIS